MTKHYSIKQVTEMIPYSPSGIKKLIYQGKIEATRIGPRGKILISENELNKILQP